MPARVAVAVLCNFRDAAEGPLDPAAVAEKLDAVSRDGGDRVRVFACSARDCFGLALLYDYLAVPFRRLQVDQQRRLLATSEARLEAATAELDAKIAESRAGAKRRDAFFFARSVERACS